MTFFDKFFDGRIELYNQYKAFDAKHQLRVLSQLSQEDNQSQFLSKISEINFGLFFDNLNSQISYEKIYDNYTPDWAIELNGQSIIAEVLRLNPSVAEQRFLDFCDEFESKIRAIEIGCCLNFKYDKNLLDIDNIDIDACKVLIENWLRDNPVENRVLVLFGSIKIVLVYLKEDLCHACLIMEGGAIKFDYRRLSSEKSALVNKAKKYTSIIEKYGLPYIVCICIDTHAWFRKDDLYQALYGLSTEHVGPIKSFSHLIENALYYSSEQVMTRVSGVLLRQNDEYTYYHNYSFDNKLNIYNKTELLKWQHPYE
ncbi:hypothetical protein J0X19_01820 [Hymenobacter sp. BT186]|uniref:Uncharacterized protein n=1 Tax=Hymenobacter telluris TaxID=2816474 RepID=A0A939ESW8_9BACT|nr:hypothetical protein [Hymenobacter telluris]MBO0356672.1 hypothetical protein [Hymenobacter telluris]MBW3372697.1 hypothetical protein [Hymenobacter norwichensis]